jgi:hypothetical protein
LIVRVNTDLGFHWICNSEKKGGVYVNWWWYQWILEKSRFDWSISIPFFSLLGTYASIDANHGTWVIESKLCIFLFLIFFNLKKNKKTKTKIGGIFLIFKFFKFLWIFKFLWCQTKGGGVMPLYGKWVCLCTYMVPSFPPQALV